MRKKEIWRQSSSVYFQPFKGQLQEKRVNSTEKPSGKKAIRSQSEQSAERIWQFAFVLAQEQYFLID